MWVIGPMVLYLCERLLRFIRYMQTVRYRKVRFHSSTSGVSSCSAGWGLSQLNPFTSLFSDRDAAVQSAGAAAGEERFQDGGGSVRLHQLPGHLSAGVAPVHHDLRPRGGLLQHPHPLCGGLDRQTHRHHAEAAGGSAGTKVSTPGLFILQAPWWEINILYPLVCFFRGSFIIWFLRENDLHIHKV